MGLDTEQRCHRETQAEGIGWERRRRRKENRKRASCHGTSMSFPGVFLEFSKRSQAHLSRVGIGFLGLDAAVVDDVLERLRHEPPGASLVPVHPGAIHQVLGAQGHQIPGFQLHLRFQSSHGAEGPAGSAGALGKKNPGRGSGAAPGIARRLPGRGSPGSSPRSRIPCPASPAPPGCHRRAGIGIGIGIGMQNSDGDGAGAPSAKPPPPRWSGGEENSSG